jgi:hypothetical protein
MIGGLYNTTSLLVEPTRALGTFLRAGDGSLAAAPLHQAEQATARAAEGLEAAKVPDRLPAGIVQFIPVVLKMMEARAAEAVGTEAVERETQPRTEEAPEVETAAETGAETGAETEGEPAPVAAGGTEPARTVETIGHYMTSAEAPDPETSLDTTL